MDGDLGGCSNATTRKIRKEALVNFGNIPGLTQNLDQHREHADRWQASAAPVIASDTCNLAVVELRNVFFRRTDEIQPKAVIFVDPPIQRSARELLGDLLDSGKIQPSQTDLTQAVVGEATGSKPLEGLAR